MEVPHVIYGDYVGEGDGELVPVSHVKAGSCYRVFHEASYTEMSRGIPYVCQMG